MLRSSFFTILADEVMDCSNKSNLRLPSDIFYGYQGRVSRFRFCTKDHWRGSFKGNSVSIRSLGYRCFKMHM